MHKLLERQIRKSYGDSPPGDPQFLAFIAAVGAAYQEGDTDRRMLEHSIELASKELLERNAQLERDLEAIKRLEMELFHAEKLRAVGQLAAGIAHEINTPIQYVGDCVCFLKSAFSDLAKLSNSTLMLCEAEKNGAGSRELLVTMQAAAEDLDLGGLLEEVPKAFEHTIEGVRQVARIVAAMKEFGRAEHSEKMLTDVTHCIESTLVVANNQLKYVADVEVTLGEVPLVLCHPAELNQVLLNLLVNAAHAIEERFQNENRRGCVRVTLEQQGRELVIIVSDDGCGIPEALKSRVFEPFFTTKAVGKGTGQGLAIARSIMEKQGGSLSFESRINEGTTFFVKLPLEPECSQSDDTGSQWERSCAVG